MASASSSMARLFIRDGKSAANLLIRARAATDTVKKPVPAIRSLLRSNTTPAYQYPIFSESFPAVQSGFHVGFIDATIWKMKAGHGKRVVDNENGDSEEDIDFDEEEIDDLDISDDEEFDDIDEDDDDDEEEEEEKFTKKYKK